MDRRRPRQKWDLTKLLLLLVAVLAVVLVVVICVAISTHNQQPVLPTDTDKSTENTGSKPTLQATEPIKLSVQSLLGDDDVTIEEVAYFEGTSDPAESLSVNGKEVERNTDGTFSCEVPLKLGRNEIAFSHKTETVIFEIERRYVVESFSPAGDESFNSGATIRFEVSARAGSEVTVQFNDEEIALIESDNQLGSGAPEGFAVFTGEYKLSNTNTSNLDLGVITYTATCDGVTEVFTSGAITCLKAAQILASDPSVTPDYGDYIDVGSGYIVEIVTYSAETFDGDTVDDYSHPTNVYLPKGTVDYCSTEPVGSGQLKYARMRCGRRVYLDKKNIPASERTRVADCYVGTLPDHNEIGFVSMKEEGNHTILTLDCLWKAPFYFDLLPQSYAYPDGGASRSYEVTACTATYIDITFCYATKFTGTVQVPAGNPVFKSAEIIQNESDCTLRLNLKKTGGFYGWDCYYNDVGQLCFQFLNPAKVTAAENAYGVDLTGVTVMIDVGHGGVDGGATGTDAEGTRWSESGRNMDLAYALRDELESIGATVIFNREGKVTLTVDERIMILKEAAPDFCVAIHHNSIAGYPDINGFECYYYDAFSQLAAKQIYLHTKESGAYKSSSLAWHNYYVSRQTTCPVVLTENGYMTNLYDLNGTLDTEVIAKKARAMAQGIADYFLMINE